MGTFLCGQQNKMQHSEKVCDHTFCWKKIFQNSKWNGVKVIVALNKNLLGWLEREIETVVYAIGLPTSLTADHSLSKCLKNKIIN